MTPLRDCGLSILRAAIDAGDPAECVRRAGAALDISGFGNVFVVGAGKAAAPMALAVEDALGDAIREGWINTKYGHGHALRYIHCNECGHPIPDEAGVAGAHQIARIASLAGADDLLLCLISGGASALMPYPIEPVTLAEKQYVTGLLLASGANIHEINAVRKHLSRIKGGRLAQLAAPATVRSLILSDVIGDDLSVIGSGPTTPDASTLAMAREVLHRYRIWDRVAASVRCVLEEAAEETWKPTNDEAAGVTNHLIGTNKLVLDAAAARAAALGFHVVRIEEPIQGEARDAGVALARLVRDARLRPTCWLAGGETTVTLKGSGKGGRNQEMALAAAIELDGIPANALFLSAGTDGTDGPTDAAGAIADPTTINRARALGLDPHAYLDNNDSYEFFQRINDLIITGPTRTNLMDVQVLLVA